jgi:hypothetical protein
MQADGSLHHHWRHAIPVVLGRCSNVNTAGFPIAVPIAVFFVMHEHNFINFACIVV